MNPDLEKERVTSPFDVERLTNVIDGSVADTARRREIHNVALKEPLFTEGEDFHFLSREQQYEQALQKSARMWEIAVQNKYLKPKDMQNLTQIAFPSENSPNSVHYVMFVPALQRLASDEQRNKWLPAALRGELIGTYAQTEMGHGTSLKNIETTATYDPETETFVIHSPTLTSTKWWPGGLGITCNCCLLMANLITQGKNYGIHPFFVQYRRLEDHSLLPGISAGDIGPKFGFSSIDNGFLKLDNFRIPRENMFMKNSEVLRDGTYVNKTTNKKANYGLMMQTRTHFVDRNGAMALAAATTIAIRYSAVRRQSELNPSEHEPQILDYRTQQHKLFPFLTMAYGFKWAADELQQLYDVTMTQLEDGNDAMQPEMHALSAGMKAFSTSWMAVGIEQCRLACGGHGYSHASGLPKLYVMNAPACTFEGDNTVLLLQTARYLMKCYQTLQSDTSTPLPQSLSYLVRSYPAHSSLNEKLKLEELLNCFQYRAYQVTRRTAKSIRASQEHGKKEWEARNDAGVELIRAAQAHCEVFVMSTFVRRIRTIEDDDISDVMVRMYRLLACYWILANSGDYLEYGYISAHQLSMLRQKESSLLSELRPAAVPLVDAFDFPDHYLCSSLGRYDGNVYRAMYDWALRSPLNHMPLQKPASRL